jgi:hypothetical protein
MTRYNVTAWCVVPYYTTFEVEARNVREALKNAKLHARDEYGDPCDDRAACNWEEFQIHPEDDEGKSRTFLEPARRVEMAAAELHEALQFFFNIMHDYECSVRKGYVKLAFEKARKALEKAKVGAI